MAKTVKLAEYLFTRLRQLDVESIFGVPGDYNLHLLDYIEPSGIHWVGTCNELNAGYAVDAYSRLKGLGALVTTFGVGELSAINAIAGANAELAPVIHIVGTPARQLQESRARVHHTLNDGNYRRFAQMHALVTVAQGRITDLRTAPEEIDRVIRECLLHSRPVYLEVPFDMVGFEVDASRLESKIAVPATIDQASKTAALDAVLQKLKSSKKPMILVDGEARAHGNVNEVHDLIRTTGWPTFLGSFAKGFIDETIPNIHGVYQGLLKPDQQEFVNSCDLVLVFGEHFSTTNSYARTAMPKAEVTISIQTNGVQVGAQIFRDIPAKSFSEALLERLKGTSLPTSPSPSLPGQTKQAASLSDLSSDEQFRANSIAPLVSSFLRSGDVVLAETGTAGYVARDFSLPPQTGYFAHTTWLSIGYMLPAALGAAVARRELHKKSSTSSSTTAASSRTILLIGDGSLQMTVQEISTMLREKLDIIIFVINNKGYLIERVIHGWKQGYNDVANWRYLEAPSFFGGKEGSYGTWKARTNAEVKGVIEDEAFSAGKGLRMVELDMHPDDAPECMWATIEAYIGKSRVEISGGDVGPKDS